MRETGKQDAVRREQQGACGSVSGKHRAGKRTRTVPGADVLPNRTLGHPCSAQAMACGLQEQPHAVRAGRMAPPPPPPEEGAAPGESGRRT